MKKCCLLLFIFAIFYWASFFEDFFMLDHFLSSLFIFYFCIVHYNFFDSKWLTYFSFLLFFFGNLILFLSSCSSQFHLRSTSSISGKLGTSVSPGFYLCLWGSCSSKSKPSSRDIENFANHFPNFADQGLYSQSNLRKFLVFFT